jgi:outer membrane protein assembly factor BamB
MRAHRPQLLVSSLVTLIVVLAIRSPSCADDWPQWLGPRRDATWRESGIIDDFPKAGATVLWRRKIGGGYAGPSVANGRVYVADFIADASRPVARPKNADSWTRAEIPGKERVLCLRESDGEVLWTRAYDCDYHGAFDYANGPRVTPTVSGGKVYALGAEGRLLCLDATTGDIVWSRDFKKDYGLETPIWGWASHPLIDGDKLICVVGGKGTTAVAFHKDSGKEIWRALSSKEPGYSAPVIYRVGERRQLLIWHGEAINGLDPETGKLFWSVETKPFSAMACATPVYADGHLFLMAYKHWSMMLELDAEPPSAKVLWRGHAKLGISGAINTPILQDGFIYADGDSGRYTCAEVATGKWRWTTYAPTTGKRPKRWATAFTVRIDNGGAKDRYVLANDQGTIIFATLTPSGYDETSRAKVIETSQRVWNRPLVWSHPAFANRRVYQRSDREIVCVSLEKSENRAIEKPEDK